MNSESLLHFDIVSRAFTALDVARPLVVVPPDTPIAYDERGFGHPVGYPTGCWCWLVADGGRTYGYVTEQTLGEEHGAKTMAELARFGRHDLVPAALPVLEVIPRLAQEDGWTLFVLTDEGVTHYITTEEFDSMPIKLCLFALLMELEAEMRHVLLSQPERLRERWGHLRGFRQEELLKNSDHGSVPLAEGIDDERLLLAVKWATLSDHQDMLFADPTMLSRFGFKNRSEANSLFHQAREVRNVVAHGQPLQEAGDDLMIPRNFAALVKEVRRVVSVFAEQRRAEKRTAEAERN